MKTFEERVGDCPALAGAHVRRKVRGNEARQYVSVDVCRCFEQGSVHPAKERNVGVNLRYAIFA